MENNKLISALSYFSVFFLIGIFPLVVYFVTEDKEVKWHAKRAFLSHISPLITVPFFILSILLGVNGHESTVPFVMIPTIVVGFIIGFIVLIWNIVQGIKAVR